MRKLSLFCAVVAVLSVAASPAGAAVVSATPVGESAGYAGDAIYLDYWPGVAGGNCGGPFEAILTDAQGVQTMWQTFCVEAGIGDEVFYPGTTYKVASTSPNTANVSGNRVSDFSKFLYYTSQATPSLLPGFLVNGSPTQSTYTSLQEAIWYGTYHNLGSAADPNYQSLSFGGAEPMDGEAVALWDYATQPQNVAANLVDLGGGDFVDLGDWANSNYVGIVNPYDPATQNYAVQSQLYVTAASQTVGPQGNPAAPIPEPASLILWLVLSAGVASIRTKSAFARIHALSPARSSRSDRLRVNDRKSPVLPPTIALHWPFRPDSPGGPGFQRRHEDWPRSWPPRA